CAIVLYFLVKRAKLMQNRADGRHCAGNAGPPGPVACVDRLALRQRARVLPSPRAQRKRNLPIAPNKELWTSSRTTARDTGEDACALFGRLGCGPDFAHL